MPGSPPATPGLSAPETSSPTGELDAGAIQGSGAPAATSAAPSFGALGIRERRSWRTWQLVLTAVGMLVLGMAMGNALANKTPPSSASLPSASSSGTLPPPASSASSSGTSPSASTTTSTATGGANSSAGPATTTTAAPATGTASVLVGPYQSKGDWTSPSFTIAGGQWNIGWAFACSPVPVSGASLEIFVVPTGGGPGPTPTVSEHGASGQSVTAQSSTGSQELIVQAPAGCTWAVKVTGIG